MTRPRALGLFAVSVCVPAIAAPLRAQSESDAVTTLLEHSEVRGVLASFRQGVDAALRAMNGEPLSPEALAIMDRQLDVDVLLPVMREQLRGRGSPALLEAAADRVSGGVLARIDSIQSASPPSSTLEEYAASLQTDPPPQERVVLVAQIAQAQAAGDFYVYLFEGMREAAHAISQATSGSGLAFEPLSDDVWDQQAQQGLMLAVVQFLHRYQAVSDELLREGLREWGTAEGSWYVEAYTLSLGETLQIATANIVAELGQL